MVLFARDQNPPPKNLAASLERSWNAHKKQGSADGTRSLGTVTGDPPLWHLTSAGLNLLSFSASSLPPAGETSCAEGHSCWAASVETELLLPAYVHQSPGSSHWLLVLHSNPTTNARGVGYYGQPESWSSPLTWRS